MGRMVVQTVIGQPMFRRVVRLLAAIALCATAAGCASVDYEMGASYGGKAAAGAGGASAGSTTIWTGPEGLYASIPLGTAAANIMAIATGVAIYAAMLQESGELRFGGYQMLEGRAINEQDCTKPITDMQANLKCK